MWAQADVPRVLPPGQLPDDRRLGELTNLNDYFPFAPQTTRDDWVRRSERLRRQVLVANGLWPMPTKTPLNAVVHGKIDRGKYTVEKVFFESFPGHFVTGNLYRPTGRQGRLPGVLCPHGHWANGRFYDAGEKKIKQEIEKGAEKFDPSGRYPLQARCVHLARMGCVVFHYDMVGYADHKQLAHRAGAREPMNTSENWGYFSPQAELRLQNIMGLQTYNSIRALDWLAGLPDVDPKRIGVTGASGGGTQTFILCAVDPRPAAAVPAVMVSTAMQGGCSCENACYLRIGTGNVEIAALFSPRPLGLLAADDWTKEMETKGFPEIKQHYTMLGVPDQVALWPFIQFPHNYNYVSRSAMYTWFNTHLKLGLKEPIVEHDFVALTEEQMAVWDDEHPQPGGGDDYERALLRQITEDSERQIAALVPTNAETLRGFREVVGGAVDVMIGRRLPEPGAVQWSEPDEQVVDNYRLSRLLARIPGAGEELPVALLEPMKWNKKLVIWINKEGKQALFGPQGAPKPAIGKLLDDGVAVLGVDLFGQGEFTADGKSLATQRLNQSGRGDWASYAGYTYGYNHPMFSQRVHDILTVIGLAQSKLKPERLCLAGVGGAGHWVAAALAQSAGAVDRAVVDTGAFRFAGVPAIDDADFLPGGAKYLDLPGMLALAAPIEMWLAGEGPKSPPVVAAAYRAAGKPGSLTVFDGDESRKEAAAVEWLLR
jgi:dienelactone hydrolase